MSKICKNQAVYFIHVVQMHGFEIRAGMRKSNDFMTADSP